MNNSLSLTKLIGGLSKILGIANQVIPLYKQAKPMLNKSFTFLSNVTDNINKISNQQKQLKENNNKPIFFQ